jgi:hypothetical protein
LIIIGVQQLLAIQKKQEYKAVVYKLRTPQIEKLCNKRCCPAVAVVLCQEVPVVICK